MSAFDSASAKAEQFAFTPQERMEFLGHARAYQKKIDRLSRLTGSNEGLARTEVQQILTSIRAKVCAIVRTTPHLQAASINLAEVYARAASLTPATLSEEAVRVRLQPKSGRGCRPITKFGPVRRAYQQLCVDMLRATLPSYPFDFSDEGGGVEPMTRFILRGLESGEYTHVVTADVRNCYGSIAGKENLQRMLRIPRWAYEKMLIVDSQTTLEMPQSWPSTVIIETDEAIRRGIPQGASPSSLVVSRAILGPVLAGAFFADRMTLYGDNISVLARSQEDGEAIYSALRSIFASSPVGSLTIGEHAIQSARKKITLVQYALTPVAPRFGGGWRIVPSWKSYRNFEYEVMSRAADGKTLEEVEAYTREWVASQRLWQPHAPALDYLTLTMNGHWQLGQVARWSLPRRQGRHRARK